MGCLRSRFVDLAGAYERIKRRRGVVDFDDLLEHVLRAMRTDPTFADVVHWRFRHLYVDEAQDLNPLQHALLERGAASAPTCASSATRARRSTGGTGRAAPR